MDRKALSKYSIIDAIVFILLFIIVSSVTFTLFYRQACAPNPDVADAYGSDMYHYALEIKGVSDLLFPYPIFLNWLRLFNCLQLWNWLLLWRLCC